MARKARVALTIDGAEYVAVPKADYLRLVGEIDAETAVSELLGKKLRAARKAAGLTQSELADRLQVKQPMISAAEQGRERVGARYAARVLRACGLPDDWTGPRTLSRKREARESTEESEFRERRRKRNK